jgi:hypothetical protein
MHGGICTDDQMSGHICHCPLGFTGLHCEIGTVEPALKSISLQQFTVYKGQSHFPH